MFDALPFLNGFFLSEPISITISLSERYRNNFYQGPNFVKKNKDLFVPEIVRYSKVFIL